MRFRSDKADWSFARRPFWLFSHVFAAAVIITFVLLGLWQADRHRERAATNQLIEERSNPPVTPIDDALDTDASADLDYRYVTASGTFLDGDFVRVANRSQGGVAGDHVVAVFELTDGRIVLVNRGFAPLGTAAEDLTSVPTGPTEVTGWLRASAERGWIGATDSGAGTRVPRLDVDAIAQRLDGSGSATALAVVPVALQLETNSAADAIPDPVPLPPIDGGPHLSYMAQWFIFATLGALFYTALLRRTATGKQRQAPDSPADADAAIRSPARPVDEPSEPSVSTRAEA